MDADAATRAWLAIIPAHERATATASTERELMMFVLGGAVTLAGAWIIARTGVLTRLRSEPRRPWLESVVGASAFMALLLALQAPFELWRTSGAVSAMVEEDVFRFGLGLVLLPPVLAVLRAAPRAGWLWLGGAAAVAAIAIVWGPYAAASGPPALPRLEPGPVSAGLAQVTRAAGLPGVAVYESRAIVPGADVTGLPGAPRITVGPSLASATPAATVKAEVAHLISHWRHQDQLAFAAVVAALAFAGFAAAGLLFAPLARLMGTRGLSSPADPAALPVLAVLAALWIGLATPAAASVIRWINVRADAEALAWSREPDGLADWLVREWDRRAVDPGPAAEAVLYTHPPLARRIRQAMAWKAAHAPRQP